MKPIMKGACEHGQRGISLLGMVVIIVVVTAVATLGVRLIPHYIEHRALVSIVGGLPAGQVHRMAQAELQETLERRFVVNNINEKSVSDVITIDRNRERTLLVLAYEAREPLVFNIDVVLDFDDRFEFH